MLVDTHVHLHPCFEPTAFLDAAAANFARGRVQHGLSASMPGCLMLTESAGVDGFGRLAIDDGPGGGWQVRQSAEPVSLVASHDRHGTVVVIAGRQVVTAEGLEVLALGTRASFADGRPLDTVLPEVARSGALVVLPWGFGKWTGRRGGMIKATIDDPPPAPVFLGDNGGRPQPSPRPAAFAAAERRGIAVLPGSDPLPFPAELERVGRYGMIAPVEPDLERPFNALREWLLERRGSPPAYGTRVRLWTFLDRQIRLQLHKRRPKS